MINKIIKFLIPISVIFIAFFVNIRGVSAVDKCMWYVYQSYITTDDSGYQAVNAIEVSEHNTEFSYALEFNRQYISNFRIYKNVDSNNMIVDNKFSSTNFESFLINSNVCPKYVIVTTDGNNESVDTAISEEFKEYYKNQYNNTLKNNSSGDGIAYYSYMLHEISKRSIVFVGVDIEDYPSTRLNKFKTYYKTDEEFYNAMENFDIDTGSMLVGIKEFYDVTKTDWFNAINTLYNGMKCSGEGSNYSCSFDGKILLRKALTNWFTPEVARLMFEEDYDMFLKCFKICGYLKYTPEDCYNKIQTLEAHRKIENAEIKDEKLGSNPCYSICPYEENNPAINYCPQEYWTCKSAYSNCKNIPTTYDYEKCMESKMGKDSYEDLKENVTDMSEQIDQDIEDAKETIQDFLLKIDGPKIDGIQINKDGYKVNCEDVVVFHTIYSIMTIMAPILVILFGTIDFVQSLMGSDEKKILEARKKFPKRLLLLVLFVAVPTIISIIMNFSGGETNLMKCIILGE